MIHTRIYLQGSMACPSGGEWHREGMASDKETTRESTEDAQQNKGEQFLGTEGRLPSSNLLHSYWKWPIYSWFIY